MNQKKSQKKTPPTLSQVCSMFFVLRVLYNSNTHPCIFVLLFIFIIFIFIIFIYIINEKNRENLKCPKIKNVKKNELKIIEKTLK